MNKPEANILEIKLRRELKKLYTRLLIASITTLLIGTTKVILQYEWLSFVMWGAALYCLGLYAYCCFIQFLIWQKKH